MRFFIEEGFDYGVDRDEAAFVADILTKVGSGELDPKQMTITEIERVMSIMGRMNIAHGEGIKERITEYFNAQKGVVQ